MTLDSTQGIQELTVIEPPKGWIGLKLMEVLRYRELLYFLAWRDVKVHYKQAALGVTWVILQPILSMVIFTVIFGKLAKLPSSGLPYPIFTFAALLPWQLFSGALMRSGTSLVSNSNLITKVYFPRLIIPVSAVVSGLIDFGISLALLAFLMAFYGIAPTYAIFALPLFVVLALASALAVGLWLSALHVKYRDVQYTIPFLMQAWLFASPVAYSSELVPSGAWQVIYGLNPMAGVIQGFRWCLLGATPPDIMTFVSIAAVLALLVSGLYYFKRMERHFADII